MSSYGMGAPHLAAQEARRRGMQSQQGARAFSPLAAPGSSKYATMGYAPGEAPANGPDMNDPHIARMVPRSMGGVGAFNGHDPFHPGEADPYGQSGAAAYGRGLHDVPALSQQGPGQARRLQQQQGIAQSRHWSGERLGQETANAQQEIMGRPGNAIAFAGPGPASPGMQPGQGLLAGMQMPKVAPIVPPAPATIPGPASDMMPAGPDAFAPAPSPGAGAAARNAVPMGPDGLAIRQALDPSVHMPDASPVPGPQGNLNGLPLGAQVWGNRADRARFAARQQQGQQGQMGQGMPEPGSLDHMMAAMHAYEARPSMATASAADMARELFYNRQDQVERMARVGGIQAGTEHQRIINRGLPARQEAELGGLLTDTEGRRLTNQGIPAGNKEAGARADMMDQTSRLGPFGRVLAALAGNDAPGMLQRFSDLLQQQKAANAPRAANAPPTATQALANLQDVHGMPQSDIDQIFGPPDKRLRPWEAHGMADRLGYGAQGLDDPHSPFSNDMRTYMQSLHPPDYWARAQNENPMDPATWSLGQRLMSLNGLTNDPAEDAAHARARAWILGRRYGYPSPGMESRPVAVPRRPTVRPAIPRLHSLIHS